ncbi:procollagen-lysine,2-oxoglutarate 5-dioxygenase 1-like, partial [Hyalella azteca]|uniref:procollagen-lysine 5-dioxygenase n=1 Tax=Hyalella azteca TaxID=294128 RepID=A0A8B7PD42_HYAAZ
VHLQVLGMGQEWEGGVMAEGLGGGQKINLLREELKHHNHNPNLVVLFSDSYDVVFTGGAEELLQKYQKLKARVVFGAETSCWPDPSLTDLYPRVSYGYRFLNSGGFMGDAATLYDLVSLNGPVPPASDDQLYYSKIFVDQKLREKFGIKLDSQCKIFQNLNHNSADVSLKFKSGDTRLVNTVFQTRPVVIHGNGPSKVLLTSLSNYLAKSWTMDEGCLSCAEGKKDIFNIDDSELPVVMVAVFVETGTPFLEEALQKIARLDYPKTRMHLFLHSQVPKHGALLSNWTKAATKAGYLSVTHVTHDDKLKEWHARARAVTECLAVACDALFSVDGDVHLDNPDTLKLLLHHNRPILGAIMTRLGRAWSTFWGAVTHDGFYARSTDYMEIVNGNRRGIWAVPYISGVYLIQKSVLEDEELRPNYIHNLFDADIAMATNYRAKDVLMYAVNLEHYGHLVDNALYPVDKLHPDLWHVAMNREDWEARYLHPDYYKALNLSTLNELPCPDVYWFPVFSERFCTDLIETMEDYGEWSGGKNTDERISGGYENVPTVDIHMTQIGFQQEALWILKEYIKPLAEKVYLGYTSDARADLIFVVRYRPTEQSFLRPHHDSSTYTINVGLNRPGIDYEGGGARFIRYNCSVVDTRMGWALMHPGRLTHYHEGLQTTKGTRYILVAFIDN